MKIRDLGDLHGPVLLFGGPYSNLHATQALVARAGAAKISGANMICTGDVVAYCGDPEATVAAIRDLGCAVVAGNCEKQLAAGAPDCGCGFDDTSQCSVLSHGWYAHALANTSTDSRLWMADLPDMAVFRHGGRRYAVIHGGASNISRFLWPVTSGADLLSEIAVIEGALGPVDGVVSGHSGLAFVRDIGGHRWINAGAIGMPPNDGAPDTRFVVLGKSPVIHRLSYDSTAAAAAMRAVGLTQGYDAALTSGHWPSEDTLPPELRRR